MGQKILIVGGGAREHALAWKLKQSPQVEKIMVAPGNAGTGLIASNLFGCEATDIERLKQLAQNNEIDLTIVGQDEPLGLGIVDAFQDAGLRIFGPTIGAAQLETSKVFAKRFMRDRSIPTANFESFDDFGKSLHHLATQTYPLVVKADGLAKGKGVFVCQTPEETARAASDLMLRKTCGDAGRHIVIEQFLHGPEVSIHALCDGRDYVLLPTAQDHKRLNDGETGPMTGGMGCIAPLPWITQEDIALIQKTIIDPTLEGMCALGVPFTGCLYVGLKMTQTGPMVMEFNVRFGDPEAEVILPLIDCDLFELIEHCMNRELRLLKRDFSTPKRFAACIMATSKGYPKDPETGYNIHLPDEQDDIAIFHGGTRHLYMQGEPLRTNGGRVLGVTAYGHSLLQASIGRAYETMREVKFQGMHFRKDIGAQALWDGRTAT